MSADSFINEALTHHQEGRFGEAEMLYRLALKSDPNNFPALELLGALLLRNGRADEAVPLLDRALVILQQGNQLARHVSLYKDLGLAMHILGRHREAATYFRSGLEIDPAQAELHVLLGGALMEQGDLTTAARCYETALRLDPNLPECMCDLGTVYARTGRFEDAITMYRRVLSINPLHGSACMNLAQMLRRTKKYDEAVALLTRFLAEFPDDLQTHSLLGIIYAISRRLNLSIEHFRRVLAQKPDDAEALLYLACIQQSLGNMEEAERNYRRSLALRSLITLVATQSPPEFRILLLFAPGAGNTPLDYLADQARYECNILIFLPGANYDVQALRGCTDVIVNLVADADQGQVILKSAGDLIDRIGKPAVNHPQKILQTDRAAIAHLLQGIPDCCVPRTRRYRGMDLSVAGFDLSPFSFPCLARLAGTHGGMNFEKIHDRAELAAFVGQRSEADYYLSDYIDYRSTDGFFRKYRFIFINEEIYPYHLAIDNKWKIHHVTTDMVNQPWMQREEQSFLENPQQVFSRQHYDALRIIQQRVGLEYFGIDCALDREGRLVVFEVNACMLVHQRNEQFPYKTEPVRRIKAAFDAMLERMAR